MALRPPADAVVALRSLDRRFRGLFTGLAEDESPDDVALRPGSHGRSALDHVVAATARIALVGQALERVLVEDDPVVEVDGDLGPADATGTVEDRIGELATAAQAVADRVERLPAADWVRPARIAGQGAAVTASGLLWDAVDGAVDHLKAAERTLAEVRRHR